MRRSLVIIIPSILFLIGVYFFYEPLLTVFSNNDVLISVIVIFSLAIILLIAIFYTITINQRRTVDKLNSRLKMWTKLSYHVNQVGDEIFNELPIGILAYDEDFEVKWVNDHSFNIFNQNLIDIEIKEINEALYNLVLNNLENGTVKISENMYDVVNKSELGFLYLFDVTDREIIKTKYNEQLPAMGIMYLDNLAEALGNLDVSEQSSIRGEYLSAIDDWITSHRGYLKLYGDDRLVFITHYRNLVTMMESKFDILDQIRNISIDNEVRVSLSIGVASWDVSYVELGMYAQNAIDLAEKRGGDQVVVNVENKKIEYFGAKLDASSKSSRVGARINAQTIRDFIKQASNVFVMGHNQADLDSYGSMLAVYNMAKVDKKEVYKISDYQKLDSTVKRVFDEVIDKEEAIGRDLLTSEEALTKINEDSLLIIVDTQSSKLVMSKEVLESVKDILIIDHHRISDDGFDAIFSYIESSASSAIELIMELFGFYEEGTIAFTPLEASIMYGGLVLDTSNFTIRTGTRTFEVAHKLRELGADPALVKMWLRKDLKRTLAINKLVSSLTIHLDRFAFMVSNEEQIDRILLAQASEEVLLIDGIDAAFTIAKLGDEVAVSARSTSNINVQLIMEYIGGGGHLNSAAAQFSNKTVNEVYNEIRKYINIEYNLEGEKMDIILLEDVKGRGKKDQVITVASGYGNFLIKQGKAIIATQETIKSLEEAKAEAKRIEENHLELMKKLANEISANSVNMTIQIGQDGKLFGSITTKAIAEAYEIQNGIHLDRKKIELSSEINSVGLYTATINLHPKVKATFEINVVEE